MKIAVAERLGARWSLEGMPQVIPEVYESTWFDDFARLKHRQHLFDYGQHSVHTYVDPHDRNAWFFVALDSKEQPQYVNQVYSVSFTATPKVRRLLQNFDLWLQASVAFGATADRAKLKGLATKIFWDYLASNGNAAITDSQQSSAGAYFWKKLLTPQAKYLAVCVDDTYTVDLLNIVNGGDRWEPAPHLTYEISKHWKESDEGRNLRVILTRASP
jgi:hypothetical protein